MTSPLAPLPERLWVEHDESRRLLGVHQLWLSDAARVRAYADAVRAVSAGRVVADLGCGTGWLSSVARRAGARRVFAIDRSPILNLARRLVRDNSQDGIEFFSGSASRIELPERADVIVMEHIGDSGYSPTMVTALADVRSRWLRPGGIIVPHHVDAVIALSEAPDGWRGGSAPEPWWMPAAAMLSEAAPVVRQTFLDVDPRAISGCATLPVTRAGEAAGLGAAFAARLVGVPAITLSNAPGRGPRSSRPNAFLPFHRAVQVAPGDAITVWFRANASADTWMYRSTLSRPDGSSTPLGSTTSLHDTPIAPDALKGVARDAVPTLTRDGRFALEVLRACAAGATPQDAAAALVTDTVAFPTLGGCERFVRRCLSADGRET